MQFSSYARKGTIAFGRSMGMFMSIGLQLKKLIELTPTLENYLMKKVQENLQTVVHKQWCHSRAKQHNMRCQRRWKL